MGGVVGTLTEVTLRVLLITVGDIRCGLPLPQVLEVLPAARLEPLPGAPAQVLGVLDLRGTLVPVLDVRTCIGVDATPLRPHDRFVVVDVGGCAQALRVDAAVDVLEVAEDAVARAESLAPSAMSCAGVARLPDGLLVIHDPARFISSRDSEALRRALHDHAARTCP